MAGTVELLRLVTADRRRIGYYLLGGWSMFALILLIALNDLECDSCVEGIVDRFLALKVLLFLLLYGMAPWVIYTLGISQHMGLGLTLPLSRSQLNQGMLFRGVVMFLCCSPAWFLLGWLLPRNGIRLEPWMFVFAALGLLLYQMYSMRVNVLWRAVVPGIFPLLIFPPHSHETFRAALDAITTPWPSVALLLIILMGLPFVLRSPVQWKDRCPR